MTFSGKQKKTAKQTQMQWTDEWLFDIAAQRKSIRHHHKMLAATILSPLLDFIFALLFTQVILHKISRVSLICALALCSQSYLLSADARLYMTRQYNVTLFSVCSKSVHMKVILYFKLEFKARARSQLQVMFFFQQRIIIQCVR